MDQQTIKAPLVAKIEAMEAKIAEYTISLEDSQIAAEKMAEIYKDPAKAAEMFKGKSEEANQIFEDSRLASEVDTLGMYRETMAADLMLCEKAFVITDTNRLMSPSGFHPSERVYIQTRIAIHCDKIPRKLPATNCELFGHNLDSIQD